MPTFSYRNLIVWQKSMGLVEEIYKITQSLPRNEIYALSNQMKRAAISIPSNIAEGQRRLKRDETIHFSGIALGSVAELETQLILVQRLYETECQIALSLCAEIGKMLTKLIRGLRQLDKNRARTYHPSPDL